jgi:hypothetical protein
MLERLMAAKALEFSCVSMSNKMITDITGPVKVFSTAIDKALVLNIRFASVNIHDHSAFVPAGRYFI